MRVVYKNEKNVKFRSTSYPQWLTEGIGYVIDAILRSNIEAYISLDC